MVKQADRCTQRTCRRSCRGIACYCRKCCWCHFKTVGFVAEHAWTLIVFFARLIGVWLMQRVKKGYAFVSAFFIKSALHFCGKDVCEILGFEDIKKTLQRQVS